MATEAVKVMVRCRPLNENERSKGSKICIRVDRSRKEVMISDPEEKENEKTFTYDDVFPMDCAQKVIYQASAFPIMESVLGGYNGTIFAYGQTGCGKTFSMMGDPRNENLKGIIPRTFSQLMNSISEAKDSRFIVMVSFLEIYNENIRDLLNDSGDKLDIKEDRDKGVYVQDLTKIACQTTEDMLNVMFKGDKNRSTGATAMNQESSRSHSLFTIYVEVAEKSAGSDEEKIRAGKLNLVDLAGSERQSKTQATGQRLEEAKKINLSLSALGNVISALVAGGKKHIPYRDSKLTRLLQDSLGGNTKTLMIAAISPADYNFEETLGTLKYASRAKLIQNKPTVNEDPKDAMLKQMADELKELQKQLEAAKSGIPIGPSRNNEEMNQKLEQLKEQERLKAQFEQDEQELDNKEQQNENELAKERLIREEMERKLEEMKNRTVTVPAAGTKGAKAMVTKEEKQEYVEMKKAFEDIEKEEQEAAKSHVKEKKAIEQITDNFDEMTEKFQKLQTQYKQICRDVRDAQHENMKEKEELLESIKLQDKEYDFVKQIISVVFSSEELQEIRNHSHWDEDKEDWIIPKFEIIEGRQPGTGGYVSKSSRKVKEKSRDKRGLNLSPEPEMAERKPNFRVKSSKKEDKNIFDNPNPSQRIPKPVPHLKLNDNLTNSKLQLASFSNEIDMHDGSLSSHPLDGPIYKTNPSSISSKVPKPSTKLTSSINHMLPEVFIGNEDLSKIGVSNSANFAAKKKVVGRLAPMQENQMVFEDDFEDHKPYPNKSLVIPHGAVPNKKHGLLAPINHQ